MPENTTKTVQPKRPSIWRRLRGGAHESPAAPELIHNEPLSRPKKLIGGIKSTVPKAVQVLGLAARIIGRNPQELKNFTPTDKDIHIISDKNTLKDFEVAYSENLNSTSLPNLKSLIEDSTFRLPITDSILKDVKDGHLEDFISDSLESENEVSKTEVKKVGKPKIHKRDRIRKPFKNIYKSKSSSHKNKKKQYIPRTYSDVRKETSDEDKAQNIIRCRHL